MTGFRKFSVNGLLVAGGIAIGLFFAEGSSRLLMPDWRDFYSGRFMISIHVPGFGVTTVGRPGFDEYFAQNNGDFRVRIRVNDFGLRNLEPMVEAKDRVWFVGDSMTFGWGVEYEEIYSAVAGRLAKTPTYNVASPGTNVCGYQALIGRMPSEIRPSAVIVGVVLENDVWRYDCRNKARREVREFTDEGNMATAEGKKEIDASFGGIKRFLIRRSALYNVAVVSLKRVSFLNELIVKLGLAAREHVDRGVIKAAEIDQAARSTAEELARLRSLLPKGTPLAVLLIPTRFEIRDRTPLHRRLRETLTAELDRESIPVIDPIENFLNAGFKPTHFAHDGHWSPLGHKLAGQAAAEWLRRQGIGN